MGFSITNSSFNRDVSYIERNAVGDCISVNKVGDDIVFTTNYVSCPRIAYCYYEEKFIFDLGNDGISCFLSKFFPNDMFQEVVNEPYCLFKDSVKKDYTYKHINFIENWSKVVVHKDGTFEKEDYPLKPYSVELKDAYDLVHKLLIKYKLGVQSLINENKFIPTLTGGVDTRCLSALWKDKGIDTFYTREVKQDGKNNVDLGLADYKCALEVANRLNIFKHINDKSGYVTMSGMYTEATRGMYKMDVNDERFIYKFIQHQVRKNTTLLPFADDLFLQIKQPKQNVFRCVLSLLLCPDLMDLDYIGTKKTFERYNNKPYTFYEEYGDYIDDAKAIIEYWGKDKCDNILNENY